MDKLKEIRDKYLAVWFDYTNDLFTKATADSDVIEIQIETFELGKQAGRDEVIKEIEEYKVWAEAYYALTNKSFLEDFTAKLNSLK